MYYRTSGLSTVVQTSKDVKNYLKSTRDSVVTKTREVAKNPNQALDFLRNVSKSYTSFIPGAGSYVDSTFDQLEELHETHGEELDKILSETTEQIQKIASDGGADATTATKIFEILRSSVSRMQEVGKKAGKDLLDKNPAIKEKLGGGYDQLISLAERGGPEAKKIISDVKNQVSHRSVCITINSNKINPFSADIRDRVKGFCKRRVHSKASPTITRKIPGSQELGRAIGGSDY